MTLHISRIQGPSLPLTLIFSHLNSFQQFVGSGRGGGIGGGGIGVGGSSCGTVGVGADLFFPIPQADIARIIAISVIVLMCFILWW